MKKITIFIVALIVPSFTFAQALREISNVNSLANRLAGIGNILSYLLVGLAVIYIIWNIVHYFIRPSGSDRSEAGMNIFWGIVGLFIVVSLWGLVNILVNTFYTDPNVPRNRFPNADFVNKNNTSSGGINQTVNSNIFNQGSNVQQPASTVGDDIRDNPAEYYNNDPVNPIKDEPSNYYDKKKPAPVKDGTNPGTINI